MPSRWPGIFTVSMGMMVAASLGAVIYMAASDSATFDVLVVAGEDSDELERTTEEYVHRSIEMTRELSDCASCCAYDPGIADRGACLDRCILEWEAETREADDALLNATLGELGDVLGDPEK